MRRGIVRLRFRCTDADGCSASTFILRRSAAWRRPAFAVTIKVEAAASGDDIIAVKLPRAALRALKAAASRGVQVTIARAGTSERTRFRLMPGR